MGKTICPNSVVATRGPKCGGSATYGVATSDDNGKKTLWTLCVPINVIFAVSFAGFGTTSVLVLLGGWVGRRKWEYGRGPEAERLAQE